MNPVDSKLQAYRKALASENDELERKYGGSASSTMSGGGGGQSSESSRSKRRGKNQSNQSPQSSWADEKKQDSSVSVKKGPSTRYVPLYSEEGQEKLVMKLPGSRKCDCQASKHKLINNCLKCGRIVCDQEGSGPCFFCGNMVCTPEEQDILNVGGKKAEDLKRRLRTVTSERLKTHQTEGGPTSSAGQGHPQTSADFSDSAKSNFSLSGIGDDLKRAIAEKDRLIEFQKNSSMRTKVYDDESDYYSMVESNPWLSKDDREKLRKKHEEFTQMRNSAKKNIKFTLDLAGRRVLEDENKMINPYGEDYMRELFSDSTTGTNQDTTYSSLDYPLSQLDENQQSKRSIGQARWVDDPFFDPLASNPNRTTQTRPVEQRSRIQDLGFNELSDLGMCLSMHQPFASLLVRGIKRFEGRSWYINHRGILWIASTGKQIPRSDIQEIEAFYRRFYNDNLPAPFPENYPTGCLLGCVHVTDCLSQEQFRTKYPAGESESPYVAICTDPRELSIKFPILGKHKIYKLDPKIHTAAKRAIDSAPIDRRFM